MEMQDGLSLTLGGTTAFDVVKASGETRKAVQLAKNAATKAKSQLGADSVKGASDAVACPDGNCSDGSCTDGNCSPEAK